MNEDFASFNQDFGPRVGAVRPTASQFGHYHGKLPASLLSYWEETGWCGYAHGLLWIPDPATLGPAVKAWFDAAGIDEAADQYHVIARSAFGDLYLWREKQGHTMIIHPLTGSITVMPPDRYVLDGEDDLALDSFFSGSERDDYDLEDINHKRLFKRALKKLGPTTMEDMYGFEPALQLGGVPTLDKLVKVDLVAHLVFLAQASKPEVIHIQHGGWS